MSVSRRLLTFLNWFATGLFTPVLALMLLERGCTLETLPLVLACYSAVVIVCEVPSGIFADLMGRKRTFLVSCGLYAVAVTALLFAGSVWTLVPGFLLYGAARAFASGSLDALFVEEAVGEKGPEALATVTGQLSLWQVLGLTAGALAGGALPNWRGYALHLAARLALVVLAALLCALLVGEERGGTRGARVALRTYLAQGAETVRQNRALGGLLLGLMAGGAALGLLEAYWQPTFTALATPAERPLLGIISAAGFLASILGNLLIRRLAGGREWRAYIVLRAGLAALLGIFALQRGAAGFIGVYGAIYLAVGGGDVMEQALLNRMVADGQRSGFLSLASLVTQLGALGAGCAAGLTVARVGVSGLFMAGGVLVLLGAAGAALLTGGGICYNRKNGEKREVEP